MEWSYYVVTGMFVATLFALPLMAVYFMWQVSKEEAEEEAVEDRKPQQCEFCDCEYSELFEADLGGEHG